MYIDLVRYGCFFIFDWFQSIVESIRVGEIKGYIRIFFLFLMKGYFRFVLNVFSISQEVVELIEAGKNSLDQIGRFVYFIQIYM